MYLYIEIERKLLMHTPTQTYANTSSGGSISSTVAFIVCVVHFVSAPLAEHRTENTECVCIEDECQCI